MAIIVKCVEILVAKEKVEAFIDATLINARNTRQEAGNLRFDINQSESDPQLFFLLEAYRDEEAVAQHKSSDYYKKWCEMAEPMMLNPRKTTNCKVIFADQL